MITNDVLIKHPTGYYKGYELQCIYEHNDEIPFAWEYCRKMIRIPKKITYFLDKSKIAEVRKTDFNDLDKDYYLVKLIDDTYLELTY